MLLGSLVAFQALSTCRAQAPSPSGFWVAGELGAGSASYDSSVLSHTKSGVALGLEGGYAFNARISLALRLSGCSLEASNLNDPAKGESISLFAAALRVVPFSGQGLFLRGGLGSLRYTNNHPMAFNGSGSGWFLGAGYEFPLTKRLHLSPVVDVTQGKLDDVNNVLAIIRDRRVRFASFGISLRFS
jgi:hypothetical protein